VKNTEGVRSSFFSWSTAGRIGFTGIFFFWICMIWNSTANLDARLNEVTDQVTAIHNIQIEFKNEIQSWKDLLLASADKDKLDSNWRSYETQYQKVSAEAKDIVRKSESPAVSDPVKTFAEAHALNHDQYKKSLDSLPKNGVGALLNNANVKDIDRPLIAKLEAAETSMVEDKKRVDKGLVDETRNSIEENLIALSFLALLAVWMPKY
jgi:methyl-accepting chemotaxis protein